MLLKLDLPANEIRVGDTIAFMGNRYMVRKTEYDDRNALVILSVFDALNDVLVLTYSPNYFKTVWRENTRTCSPCYDSDCDCIWDQVNG